MGEELFASVPGVSAHAVRRKHETVLGALCGAAAAGGNRRWGGVEGRGGSQAAPLCGLGQVHSHPLLPAVHCKSLWGPLSLSQGDVTLQPCIGLSVTMAYEIGERSSTPYTPQALPAKSGGGQEGRICPPRASG